MIEETVKTLIATTGYRVYAGSPPQGTAEPFFTYQVASREEVQGQSGLHGATRSRFRVVAAGGSYGVSKTMIARLKTELKNSRCPWQHENDYDSFGAPGDGSDKAFNFCVMDFYLWSYE